MKNPFSGIVDAMKQRSKNRQAVGAAMAGDFTRAVELVKGGADPNYAMPYEEVHPIDTVTIMANVGRAAVARNNTKVLDELLTLGLDKDLRLGSRKHSLLYYAVDNRAEDAALMLLHKGAKVNAEEFPHMATMAGGFGMHGFIRALKESAAEQAKPPAPAAKGFQYA